MQINFNGVHFKLSQILCEMWVPTVPIVVKRSEPHRTH